MTAGRQASWTTFVARRIGRAAISLLVLVIAASFVIHLIPGDPVRTALGFTASEELVAQRRADLGLDQPVPRQVADYVAGLARGDLGVSIPTGLPVADTIGDRLGATLQLAIVSFVAALVVAVGVGLAVAKRTHGGAHRGSELGFTSTSAVLAAIPEFIVAVGLVWIFAVTLDWFPVAGKRDGWRSFVLPVVALGLGPAAALARIVRVEALAVLDSDFVRTARAKRLSSSRLYLRHVFPNALTSTLTVGGLFLLGMVVGTVLVESVFSWPGLGTELVHAIVVRDYPMVQGMVVVFGALVLAINLLVDLLLAAIDPRSTIRDH